MDKTIQGETIATFAEKTNEGMSGDHCETLRTELFKSVLFPEFEGEKFVGEGAMWYLATQGYKVVYSDRVVYLCEYLENGLTKSGRAMRIKNPRGGMWHAYPFMGKEFKIKIRLKNALLFNTYSYFAHCENKISCKPDYKLILLCTKLQGYLLYIFWKNKYIS